VERRGDRGGGRDSLGGPGDGYGRRPRVDSRWRRKGEGGPYADKSRSESDCHGSPIRTAGCAGRTIQSLRELIFDLRRPPADQRDLRAEIDDLITRLGSARRTEVEVTYNGVFAGITESTIDSVLQLVREALSNALRHSEAETISVAISAGEDRVGIEIRDNGRGFDLAVEEPGLGLSSMGSRTDRAGGTLRIATAPGEGTVVSMTVPLLIRADPAGCPASSTAPKCGRLPPAS
jgi:signal transduction histidine kinase